MYHQPVPLASGQIHYRLNLLLLTRNQPETGIYTCIYIIIIIRNHIMCNNIKHCEAEWSNKPTNQFIIPRFPSMCVQVMTFEPHNIFLRGFKGHHSQINNARRGAWRQIDGILQRFKGHPSQATIFIPP